MALYSRVTYAGTGAVFNASFSFPYLNTSDIYVYVDGVSVPYTFLNTATVTPVTNPVSGAVVQVRRDTQKITSPVDFTDGSVILERDLDLLATYNLYLAQEASDAVTTSIALNTANLFDAQDARVINLANPVDVTDAVNRQYFESVYTPQLDAKVSTAAASASAASTSATGAASNASTSASNASTSASEALASKNAAAASQATASTAASAATTQATGAATSATTASTQATNAVTSASTASTGATNSASSATAASGSASTAATQATNAASSATAASTSAANAAASATNAASSATAAAGYSPTQSGNSGKFLTTNGTATSWATVDALPDQTSNSGKYLTTNGTDPSWDSLDTDANSTTKGLYEMANTISANYSITSGNNAMSAGPIVVNSGVSVTIPSGSRWTIV